MPLFKRATSIDLHIDMLYFRLLPAGDFEKLEEFTVCGNGFVNPSVFLHRCPRLRKLDMFIRGDRLWESKIPLAVESKSLEEVTWQIMCSRSVAVQIVAPELKKFRLTSLDTTATVSLSAPKLEEFYLQYGCTHSRIGSSGIWLLVQVQLEMMKGWWSSKHGHGQGHLPRFRDERVLSLIVQAHEVRRTLLMPALPHNSWPPLTVAC